MYAILALYVTFYVMCYARLLVCNAKALIHLQNIIPYMQTLLNILYKVDNKHYFIRNDKHAIHYITRYKKGYNKL